MPSTTLQVDQTHIAIDLDHLPAIGTQIPVHKHLTKSGNSCVVEVIGHRFTLDESSEGVDGLAELNLRILTKTIR